MYIISDYYASHARAGVVRHWKGLDAALTLHMFPASGIIVEGDSGGSCPYEWQHQILK